MNCNVIPVPEIDKNIYVRRKYFLTTNMIIIIIQNIFLFETKLFLSISMRVRVGILTKSLKNLFT